METCDKCHGKGTFEKSCHYCTGFLGSSGRNKLGPYDDCTTCHGDGYSEETCDKCNGEGEVESGSLF